jgi:hypothetical protein
MGHFAMMVNDRASDVGCALVRFTQDDLYNAFFVCNYGSNNHIGRPVYQSGSSCSNCVTGCNKLFTALCTADERVDPNHEKLRNKYHRS